MFHTVAAKSAITVSDAVSDAAWMAVIHYYCHFQSKVCNEFVTISDVFFDAAHVAAGGVHVALTMGTTIDNSFFIGFNVAGVQIDQGHETMVTESWMAEYYWSEHHPKTECVPGRQAAAVQSERQLMSP